VGGCGRAWAGGWVWIHRGTGLMPGSRMFFLSLPPSLPPSFPQPPPPPPPLTWLGRAIGRIGDTPNARQQDRLSPHIPLCPPASPLSHTSGVRGWMGGGWVESEGRMHTPIRLLAHITKGLGGGRLIPNSRMETHTHSLALIHRRARAGSYTDARAGGKGGEGTEGT
jgi:hypothetical protein